MGSGAFGDVYLGHDIRLDEPVALKFVRPEVAVEPSLRRERCALRILADAGVNPLLDEGTFEGRGLLVMPYIDGEHFPGPCPSVHELKERLCKLLHILARVHAVGVVHRDIKPGNVLVDCHGGVVLLDFGLAAGAVVGKHTTAASGTPRYAAPEQLWGQPVGPWTDLYAVGLMVVEHLGLGQHWLDDPVRRLAEDVVVDLPDELQPLLGVLRHRANERVQSARYLLARLGRPVACDPPDAPGRRPAVVPTVPTVEEARAALSAGRPDEALAFLQLLSRYDGGLDARALDCFTTAAIQLFTPRAIDSALVEVDRCRNVPEVERGQLRHLLHAAWVAARGDGRRAWTLMESADGPASLVWGVRVRAAVMCPELWEQVSAGLQTNLDTLERAWALTWVGLLEYRRGRFGEAAVAHGEASAHATSNAQRAACWQNEAAARMELGNHDEVVVLAIRCQSILEEHSMGSIRARVLERAARYRRGDPLSPDRALVEQVALHRQPDVTGYAALTEAAVAWRAGEEGADLVDRSVRAFASLELRDGWLLARAFQAHLGGARPGPREVQAYEACELPLIRLQAAALAKGELGRPDVSFTMADTRARREVLSVEECLALLDVHDA